MHLYFIIVPSQCAVLLLLRIHFSRVTCRFYIFILFISTSSFLVTFICLILYIPFSFSSSSFILKLFFVFFILMRNCKSLTTNYGEKHARCERQCWCRRISFSDVLRRWNMRKRNFSSQPESPQRLHSAKSGRHPPQELLLRVAQT